MIIINLGFILLDTPTLELRNIEPLVWEIETLRLTLLNATHSKNPPATNTPTLPQNAQLPTPLVKPTGNKSSKPGNNNSIQEQDSQQQ
jgi:hypothetical protein